MVTEIDLSLDDGRTLHVYDTGTGDGTAGLAVFWQHGTPSGGAPPEPLLAAAAERGIRWSRMTGPGTAGQLRTRAGTWRQRRPTSPESPTR